MSPLKKMKPIKIPHHFDKIETRTKVQQSECETENGYSFKIDRLFTHHTKQFFSLNFQGRK